MTRVKKSFKGNGGRLRGFALMKNFPLVPIDKATSYFSHKMNNYGTHGIPQGHLSFTHP